VELAARAVHDVEWRLLPGRALTAVRTFDWRRLPNMDGLDLRRAAVAMSIVLVVVLSAAWTIRARASARAGRLAAQTAAAVPAPVIKGLIPAQKVRTREDVQPVAIAGQHFVDGMSVTISSPNGLVATYGSESLSNVAPARLTLRALFEVPGTYHLVVRTPAGARSNEVTFVLQPEGPPSGGRLRPAEAGRHDLNSASVRLSRTRRSN
jgi:hypothetical protein